MAASSLKSLQYRTFDELLGEVMTDLSSYNADNSIEAAELIKIAQKCNYKLGLKINQTKETILDVEHGKAKLPADFYQMNVALLCTHYSISDPLLTNNIQSQTVMTSRGSLNITSCPCWTVTCTTSVSVPVTPPNGTATLQTFPAGVSKICAMNIDISNAAAGTITLETNSFCYFDHSTATYNCSPAGTGTCSCNNNPCTCNSINPDPWFQNKVYSTCDNTVGMKVIQHCGTQVREWTEFEKLYMVPSKEATAFCINTQFRDCRHNGQIRGNFLYTTANTCSVYICYEGVMEDDNGNLLVLDHPLINDYYEWSLKERILENLYLNGEPDIERRLQLAQQKLKISRTEALTLVATPDYADVMNKVNSRRSDIYYNFIRPFERQYGWWSTYGYTYRY